MSAHSEGPTQREIYKVALASIIGSVIEQYPSGHGRNGVPVPEFREQTYGPRPGRLTAAASNTESHTAANRCAAQQGRCAPPLMSN